VLRALARFHPADRTHTPRPRGLRGLLSALLDDASGRRELLGLPAGPFRQRKLSHTMLLTISFDRGECRKPTVQRNHPSDRSVRS